MNDKTLASIVITSYNYGRFLSDAIGSALAQSYPQVEVIVVGDGTAIAELEGVRRQSRGRFQRLLVDHILVDGRVSGIVFIPPAALPTHP
jgi:GT2 family glycosyltransferase